MAKNSLDTAVDLDYAPRKLAFGLPALTRWSTGDLDWPRGRCSHSDSNDDRVGLLRDAGNHRPGNHDSATDQVLRVTLRRPSADGRDPDADDLGLLPC